MRDRTHRVQEQEFHQNGKKHDRKQATNSSKEQEQTEEGVRQELEEQDNEQGHNSPEEQEGNVRHPMRQKSGWCGRK